MPRLIQPEPYLSTYPLPKGSGFFEWRMNVQFNLGSEELLQDCPIRCSTKSMEEIMRALVVASMAASLLFTGATPSSAEAGKKFKAYLDALVDLQSTPEETVDAPPPKAPPQQTPPKPQ